MAKKAVDVVLLPEETMMDKAIQANTELVEKFGKKIVLNKESCLPHISLAMGCIDEKDIVPIERLLETLARERKELIGGLKPTLPLTVTGIRTSTNVRGEKVSVFEIEKTKELQLLHEKIMKKMVPYFIYDVTSEMLYGDEQVAETSLLWIKNYPEKASFTNFFPHITIGYGEIENGPFPIPFTVSRLALCHLGNQCTCRKILVSVDLGSI